MVKVFRALAAFVCAFSLTTASAFAAPANEAVPASSPDAAPAASGDTGSAVPGDPAGPMEAPVAVQQETTEVSDPATITPQDSTVPLDAPAPVAAAPEILVSHVLWRGEWSDDVWTLQRGLAHYFPECVDFAPDGGFGVKTEAAVKCVQRKLGVGADGGFGYSTTYQLRQRGIVAAVVQPVNTAFNLVQGQQDSEYVRNLQTWMMLRYPEACRIAHPDTTFGAMTAACVRGIRAQLGLADSAMADKEFADAMRADSGAPVTINEAPAPKKALAKATLWPWQRNYAVRAVQQGLNKYFPQYAGFYVDSTYGGKTTAAVRSYQKARGITPDGGVGMITAKALRADGIPVWIVPATNFSGVLSYGDYGYKVEVLQTALVYMYGDNPACDFVPDAGFGVKTKACVKYAQGQLSIGQDGQFGKYTTRALAKKGFDFTWGISRNATLDAKLEKLAAQHPSLWQAYKYTASRSYFHYIGAHGKSHPTGSFEVQYGLNFFNNGGGNCYSFASGFMWLARSLGYDQARVKLGYVKTGYGYAPHGWVEIPIGGTTYVFDPDMDNAAGTTTRYYYKTYSTAPVYYYDAAYRSLG